MDTVSQVIPRRQETDRSESTSDKVAGNDEFKIRDTEARQRSTPLFIADVQRDCLERLGAAQSPKAVLARLERAIEALHAGDVAVERLVERNRVSKELKATVRIRELC